MSGKHNHNPVVLVVDDTPITLELMTRYLKRAKYHVLTAQTGHAAIRLAQDVQPDLILLDVSMPEMDGFEACQRLKANQATKDIPVIFTTALTDVNSKLEGFRVGGVDYVTKPINGREVLARVDTHLTIRSLQKKLQAEIIERKKAEEALRQYAAELQLQNQELDAFAHTVAHDLKNPLGAIQGIAEILVAEHSRFSVEEIHESLQAIARSGRKANNIVDELLILASVRRSDITPLPLNMAAIITEAQQRLADMITDSKAEFILPASWPVALGHAPWVEEVWVNYICNAIKYGGQPPQIELGATLQPDDTICFWIKDNGPGLSAEEQQKLFTPFTRLGQVRAQGYGLGLSIVDRIVEKLGGRVGVQSKGIAGQGSTFSFTLPAA